MEKASAAGKYENLIRRKNVHTIEQNPLLWNLQDAGKHLFDTDHDLSARKWYCQWQAVAYPCVSWLLDAVTMLSTYATAKEVDQNMTDQITPAACKDGLSLFLSLLPETVDIILFEY